MTIDHTAHKTLKSGSIDYAYYDRKARKLRSHDTIVICSSIKTTLQQATGAVRRFVTKAVLRIVRLYQRIGCLKLLHQTKQMPHPSH
ncbi:hypothetical protein [Roseibium sp.]|uniref:hypothetical protein n=1 Tax=Roseibium sp. TaxID=1936156 RepID=UPI003B51E8D2